MNTLTWTTLDPRTWRARSTAGDYLIHRTADDGPCTLEGPDRVWRSLPDLEVAQEVAAHAEEVRDDDHHLPLYRVVTAAGARCGETFGAPSDDDALRILRARRRAGNLPLSGFRLETEHGRAAGSWRSVADLD
ncbi:hypothetical protein [Cellulosimicrobium sp. CUA-896]|uniref:hypothetical protein n=1 Tax=Cellulosimicrobium sp. CUA-896 TaxID=1517881 RepID=UPI00095E5010|nr:hypothetical protein [Cellulosimicrobium sp. CUA-896]OLT54343.1 hypothetical protein BJF88_09355 [Cellulosimicrobium sp. CUA-896]